MGTAAKPLDRNGAVRRRRGGPPSTTAAVAKFAAAGLAALAVLGVATFFVTRGIGNAEAVSDAKRVTRLVGTGIVEPQLDPGLIADHPAAVARFDRIVRRRVLQHPIVRTKIWTPGGRLVYSDEPALIGSRFPLAADERHVLRTGGVDAEISDLTRPENRFERGQGELLEVYLPIRGPGGRTASVRGLSARQLGQRERGSDLARLRSGADRGAAAPGAGPGAARNLAWPGGCGGDTRSARHFSPGRWRPRTPSDGGSRATCTMASSNELAGTSFSLSAAAERSGRTARIRRRGALRQGATETRQGVRELRSLLVEIYPPSLEKAGTRGGARRPAGAAGRQRREANLTFEAPVDLPSEVESLFFRIAQEAIRNVVAHADADTVNVEVASDGDRATLRVEDDGRGFRADEVADGPKEGHLGLRMIEDVAASAGAAVEIESSPGEGTRLRVDAPMRHDHESSSPRTTRWSGRDCSRSC